jgi:hypothetical protein
MYSVRNINGTTRWSSGKYSKKLSKKQKELLE